MQCEMSSNANNTMESTVVRPIAVKAGPERTVEFAGFPCVIRPSPVIRPSLRGAWSLPTSNPGRMLDPPLSSLSALNLGLAPVGTKRVRDESAGGLLT